MSSNNTFILGGLFAALFAFGCTSDGATGDTTTRLAAECVDEVPDDAELVCPDLEPLECEDGGADPDIVFFTLSEDGPEECADIEYELNDEGPFEVGEHPIVISERVEDGEDARVFCETTLIVQDTLDPEPVEEPVELWPPNHKWHTITGADCVKDLCDGDDLQVTFSYATSDEPVNDKGDGNTEPDIILECDRVQLRAERQGPSNGRVYKLGYKAVDDSGKTVEDVCTVVVPHDQSGREAIDDGPAYTLELDDDECDDGTGGAGGEGGSGGDDGAGGDDGDGGAGGDGGVIVP